MLDAFYIAAIGLQAQKEQLDTMANNLANVGTTAFKRQSVDFSSILDRAPAGREIAASEALEPPRSRVLRIDFAPGEIRTTGRPLDIAIIGAGFFEVELPNDQTGYSRAGSLQVNRAGVLTVAGGQPLKVDIRVPSDASALQVLPDGSVVAVLSGDREPTVLGQIEITTFANPELLAYQGEGVFTAPESAEPNRALPGEDGAGRLEVQRLEGSNVELTDALVSMLLMQRIYELNSRVAQVADEMIGMSNNLRQG